MLAGANFIKTSTGKEAVNATLPVGLVMCRAIRHFYQMKGIRVCVMLIIKRNFICYEKASTKQDSKVSRHFTFDLRLC